MKKRAHHFILPMSLLLLSDLRSLTKQSTMISLHGAIIMDETQKCTLHCCFYYLYLAQ